MLRSLRLSISLKFAFLVTAFLLITFIIVTPVVVGTITQQAKGSLVEQSRSFATLSTRPIGDAFLIYKDSGLSKLHQEIEKITETGTTITNVVIVDVLGEVLYEHHKDMPITLTQEQAASFEPIFELDEEGFLRQVTYPFLEQSGAHRYTMIYTIDSADIHEALDSIRNKIMITALVLTVLADLTLVIFIQFLFVRPLRLMSYLAVSISAGNYGQSVILRKGRDEISELGDSLNQMAKTLSANIEALKSAEKLKPEFLIISSHNLRTPLTVISGYLEMLSDMEELDLKTKQYIATIQTHANELSDLTNDMLTVAELEGGNKPKLNLTTVDAAEVLRGMVPQIENKLVEKSQRLQVAIPLEPVPFKTQTTYLQTAISNLIDNAHKFTPPSGTISLELQVDPSSVRIVVSDTGIGIAPDEVGKLFTKFHRGTSTMEYQYEGVGLGLYMTKLMIDLLGGEISVDSQVGRGSTFTIILPKSNQPLAPATEVHPIESSPRQEENPPLGSS